MSAAAKAAFLKPCIDDACCRGTKLEGVKEKCEVIHAKLKFGDTDYQVALKKCIADTCNPPPTASPTQLPTPVPTPSPTAAPTPLPTLSPTPVPTPVPTEEC